MELKIKTKFVAIAVCAVLIGCGQQNDTKQGSVEPAKIAQAEPVKTHNYSLRDGFEYGYEQALSNDDINRGQVAQSIVMAKYAGTRDGKYQIYILNPAVPGSATVAECTNPCEFMKVMSFFQGKFVSVERLRVVPGILGWMILQDAINGDLEQYFGEKKGQKFSLWFDEKKGLVVTPVPEKL